MISWIYEAKAGRLQIQGQPRLHWKNCLKKKKKQALTVPLFRAELLATVGSWEGRNPVFKCVHTGETHTPGSIERF